MDTPYQPIDGPFQEVIASLAQQRKYVGILYFTPLYELISTTAIITEIVTLQGNLFMRLTTGEEIRLDKVVRVDNTPSPHYTIDDYTCDC